jgi:hypothetical protein
MKITAAVAAFALFASQAVAVVPTPIASCTKSVVVMPGDPGCGDFAARYGTTFDKLLEWNLKLRPDCLNLDVCFPICVSITPGAGTLAKPIPGCDLPGYTPSGGPAPTSTGQPTAPPPTSSAGPGNSTARPTTTAPSTVTSQGLKPPTSTLPGNSAGNTLKASAGALAGVILSVVYLL